MKSPLDPARSTRPAGATPAALLARLPQLDRDEMRLRNGLYAQPAFFLDQDKHFIWQTHAMVHPVGVLQCRAADGEVVEIAADGLSQLEPRLLGFESFVPSEACTALVEHALSPVLGLLERAAGRPLTCEVFKRGGGPEEAQAPAVKIDFQIVSARSNARSISRGWVSAPPGFWRQLEFSRLDKAAGAKRYLSIPMLMRLWLGRCTLPAFELRQLVAGDALRFSPRISRQQCETRLPVQLTYAGGLLAGQGRLNGEEFILETLLTTMTTPLPPKSHVQPQPAARPTEEDFLSSVDCELTFELGSLKLTLGEVGKLRSGQAFRLGVNLKEQPVRILTSGRQIARGELAAMGDELVVVVTDTHGLPQI